MKIPNEAVTSDVNEGTPTETKEQAFQRIGNRRLVATVKQIRLLANLSGPSYSYTPQQVEVLINTLRDEVDKVEIALGDKNVDIPQL